MDLCGPREPCIGWGNRDGTIFCDVACCLLLSACLTLCTKFSHSFVCVWFCHSSLLEYCRQSRSSVFYCILCMPGSEYWACKSPLTFQRSRVQTSKWFCELMKANLYTTSTTTTPVPFNGVFSRPACVSKYQKGKTSLDLNEAKDDGGFGMQWHQLDHMQTICTLVQTDTTPTTHHSVFTGRMLFLMPSSVKALKATYVTLIYILLMPSVL